MSRSVVRAVSKRTARSFTWREVCEGWALLDVSGLHLLQERMPPGTSEINHLHRLTRQFYFVLQGTATVQVGRSRASVARGAGIEIPPGTPHQIRNDSAEPLEFLVISTQPPRGDRIDLS